MKIETMRLLAYGPFTDVDLDFSRDGAAFHILYGPNEAGKSSALRALRGMLFGIQVRTPDSFLHPNPKLRIGASLLRSDGSRIEFIRRKGRNKTLRGPDDETVMDEEVLASFLGTVDQGLFEQMFAIGHEELVSGGQEIIEGGGSVGQALFAAGAGLIRLQQLRQRLEQECDTLFKPGGSKPVVNSCVSLIQDARKRQKEALLLAKTWKTHHDSLQTAQQRLQSIQEDLTRSRKRVGALERIGEALPLIARKKELDAELTAYDDVPSLSEDFSDRRREAENALGIAANDADRAQETIDDLGEQLDQVVVPEKLIENAEIIEALQHDLGSFKKANADRPGLFARKQMLSRQVSEKLSEAGREISGHLGKDLKLPPAVVGEIQELAKTYERLIALRETTEDGRRKLETDFRLAEEEKQQLPEPIDVSSVRLALKEARNAGPIEHHLGQARSSVSEREAALTNGLNRQTLWTGTLEALDSLPCPTRESIDRFDDALGATRRKLERLREERALKTAELRRLEAELRAIEISRDVPTEENLAGARSLRDGGWRLLRGKIEGREPSDAEIAAYLEHFETQSSLQDAYEDSVGSADTIADRLRREAEQVGRKATLDAGRERIGTELEEIESAIETAAAGQEKLEKEWQKIWEPTGVSALSPPEMRAWVSDIEAIREKHEDLKKEKINAERTASTVEALKIRLANALEKAEKAVEAGASLATLVEVAEALVTSRDEAEARRDRVEQELLRLQKARNEADAKTEQLGQRVAEWAASWERHVQKIGVSADTSPSAALAVIDSIREAKKQRDEAEVLEKRISGIDRDGEAFRQRVEQMVADLAPELAGEQPETAAPRLNALLTGARAALSTHNSLSEQLGKALAAREAAQKRMADATTQLQSLCREAGCSKPEELVTIESRFRERRRILEKRDDIEYRLRELSAGATVEAFIAEAEQVDGDSIPPELQHLADEITALEAERSELDQTIGTEKAELRRMDGSAAAAEHAQEAERMLAQLESSVEAYARAKIASVILSRTIERYRQRHQGPLIKRASELFSHMTLGSFSDVRAEYDENGSPVLVGVRPNGGEQVPVAGMSDGTADQLYLALRLASLEQYLENSESLPFVVDDILLRFDDARAAATLEILAGLSKRTQVVFFTHHRHLVDLAERNIDSSTLVTHTLER